eukprot:1670049-Rhodomonas_salina.2
MPEQLSLGIEGMSLLGSGSHPNSGSDELGEQGLQEEPWAMHRHWESCLQRELKVWKLGLAGEEHSWMDTL